MKLLSSFGLIHLCAIVAAASSADINELSRATAKFALDLLKASGNSSDESVIFSPASISVCVGMAYAGSGGKTKDQINKAVYNGLSDKTLNELMKNLSETLNQPSTSYNLSIANRFYVQKKFDILKPYLNTLKDYYYSEIKSVDFVKKAEETRKEINTWVEEKTNSKIKNLIPKNTLNNAIVALVNAIYFKGDWSHMFNQTLTSKKTFHSTNNSQIQVDMMKQTRQKFYYKDHDDVQVLGLPYIEDLAMYIILPKQKNGLSEVEAKLTDDKFIGVMQDASETEMTEVQLPKFKLEKTLSLTDVLKSLGMTDMFDQKKANFSGIDGNTDLYVSAAIHKAFIEVNERGSEAAAATALVLTDRSLRIRPSFIADHPFLFSIVDRRIWNPLFFGRYAG